MCGICGCHHVDERHERTGTAGHPSAVAEVMTMRPEGCDAHRQAAPDAAVTERDWTTADHLVRIERAILSKNDGYAAKNRERLAELSVLALNLVSSPGAGKTSLLVATVERLRAEMPVAVIEGDQETENDAERIRATGTPAAQINTGRGCHLDAHMVGHAMDDLPLELGGVLFIENVGNLVCPATFDLGEAHKVAILSVTEGDDKPLKYPDMFAAAHMLVISKTDLLPHVQFDPERAADHARRLNPDISVLQVSVQTRQGLDTWFDWIRRQSAAILSNRLAALERERELLHQRLCLAGERRPRGVAI